MKQLRRIEGLVEGGVSLGGVGSQLREVRSAALAMVKGVVIV